MSQIKLRVVFTGVVRTKLDNCYCLSLSWTSGDNKVLPSTSIALDMSLWRFSGHVQLVGDLRERINIFLSSCCCDQTV